MRVAIIGGGPAGLMSADQLERRGRGDVEAVLFEAADRLGGKLQTRTFAAAPMLYEAGIAECYDYEAIGPDPLKALVRELGLDIRPTHGASVVIDGTIIDGDHEIGARLGEPARRAIAAFRERATSMVPPSAWHRGFRPGDDLHPWAGRSFDDILEEEIPDAAARRYLAVTAHSDLATDPHLANGLVGVRNVLKSVPGYGAQYTIGGGMGMLARALAGRLTRTRMELGARVVRISRTADGYELRTRRGGIDADERFDALVLALPYNQLYTIDVADDGLRRAIRRHAAHYDVPGHYLRVSMLFDRPFWRSAFASAAQSWVMLDAFGGCCVYDEGATHDDTGGCGALGWLLAGIEALLLSNADDRTIASRVIESLPAGLAAAARRHRVETRIHRWVGGVSGQPGGYVLRDPQSAHRPEPAAHPRVVVAGDYLFDSTLNGVLRSARIATDLLFDAADADGRPFRGRPSMLTIPRPARRPMAPAAAAS